MNLLEKLVMKTMADYDHYLEENNFIDESSGKGLENWLKKTCALNEEQFEEFRTTFHEFIKRLPGAYEK